MTVEFDVDAIPAELKERDQWLLWDAGANDKKPRTVSGGRMHKASWTTPDQYLAFEKAVSEARKRESVGIGYVFAKGIDEHPRGIYGGLDLDGCVSENGGPKEWLPDLEPFFDQDAFAEYSPSGGGIHIPLVGLDLPEWWSDCSLGEHEGVEAYEKKFFTFTGDTLRNSGDAVAEHDESVTEWLKAAYENITGDRPWEQDTSERNTDSDDSTDKTAAAGTHTRGNAQDIADAIDRLDARDVAAETIVSNWNDDHTASGDNRAFYPVWGSSDCNGTANIVDRKGWTDTGGSSAGGPLEMAAIDMDELSHHNSEWGAVEGDLWGDAVDHLREKGFSIPEYEGPSGSEPPAYEDVDDDEVERGEEILAAETSPTDPAGSLEENNGHYGYWTQRKTDTGEFVDEFDPVTNFTLETLERVKTDEGELLKICVHPANPTEGPYEVEVHPTDFNETRAFKEEIVRGRTTRYEPGKRSQQALNDLRESVGTQLAPQRKGREHIGLAGDEHDEWVTPLGTMHADGDAENPEHTYYAKGGDSQSAGGALARKWNLDPETIADYDSDDVAEMTELLPQTRRLDRGLPILGWFYAAPLRPLVMDWEGEFNLLQVVGTTGTGKTSTLKMYWEAFGMDPDPFSASATPFTIMKHMSSSSGVPVLIDEYKPADIRNDRLDKLHRRLRESTKGSTVSKGQANLGEVLFHLRAPTVISGEQKFSKSIPAVRRRTIMTNLSQQATREGSEYVRAFSELSGTPYEKPDGTVAYPSGYDLSDHARAYYQYILQQEQSDLEELWRSARDDTGDILSERGLALEKTEYRGAVTVLFGVRLFRRFAKSVGADESALPTDDDVAGALEHFASNIGKDGKRMGYDDGFLELVAQAAKAGYIHEGENYRFIESQKWGTEVLAFHMPSTYASIKKYVRDYNLEDEHNIIGKNDYIDAFADKADREGTHVKKVNHTVRFDDGRTKTVVIDPEQAERELATDFELRAFGRGDESDGNSGATKALGALPFNNDQSFTATVVSEHAGGFGEMVRGELEGPRGTRIEWYVPEGQENPIEGCEGDSFRFEGVKIESDKAGLREAVIRKGVEVTEVQSSTATGLDDPENSAAATDGGEKAASGGVDASGVDADASGLQADADRVAGVLRDMDTPASRGAIVQEVATARELMSPGRAKDALEHAENQGDVSKVPRGGYVTN